MAIQYFPRLDESAAIKIIAELVGRSVSSASEMSAVSHPDTFYYPTASVYVSEDTLRAFRQKTMDIAHDLEFPQPLNKNRARELDQRISEVLFQDLELIPAEAANAEVWNFLTLVVLPDIAKWRYPNEKKILDYNRWLGGDRNVIRKLWWREATLGHDLNSRLGEDEAVGIMERPLLGGQTHVARAMVRALLKMEEEFPNTARSELLRAGAVNLRRYAPFMAFEFFSEDEIYRFVLDLFRSSSSAYMEKARKEKETKQKASGQESLNLENTPTSDDNRKDNRPKDEIPTSESPTEEVLPKPQRSPANKSTGFLSSLLRRK